MKKKFPMALLFLGIYSLLAVTNLLNLSAIMAYPAYFGAFGILSSISSLLITLMPFALVVVLVLCGSKDMQKITQIGLYVFSGCHVLKAIFSIIDVISIPVGDAYFISCWIGILATLCTALTLFFAADAVKKAAPRPPMFIFGILAMAAHFVPSAAYLLLGAINVIGLAAPFLLLGGLLMLPKTVYNYEHCFVVSKSNLKAIGVIAVVIVIILVIIDLIANGGSTTGNCFNCGGDGWDSANNCRCVWCGGDGEAVWNP